jgi:NADPH2:quinone reductase
MDWVAKGDLQPYVGNVLPFSQTLDGLEMLRNRKATGKLVIQMP